MAIKFENTSGQQGKAAEKKAEAAKPPVVDEDKAREAEEAADDKASGKTKKPRAGFRKK